MIKHTAVITYIVMVFGVAGCGGGESGGSATPPTYVVGGTVIGLIGSGLVLQNNAGNNLNISASGAFTFPTAVADGTSYLVTVLGTPTSPRQICTVTNGTGSVNAANVTNVGIACGVFSGFAYVTNYGANTVSPYSINASTGELVSIGTAVATGAFPYSIAVHPSDKFAYVANGGGTVSAFSINLSTGLLTSISSPVAAGTFPYSIAVDPTGKFAYVVNATSNNISIFTIDPITGMLTNSAASVAAEVRPTCITVDPTGKFAYVTNSNSDSVSGYTINAATGELVIIGAAVATGVNSSPTHIDVDPTGRFAYVANMNGGSVSTFSINTITGVLTPIGSSVAAGISPYSVIVDPTGKFAYVANNSNTVGGNSISAFSIDATTGVLTSIGLGVATGTSPWSIAFDPAGKFAYVTNFSSYTVSSYTLNANTGVLTSLGAAVNTGNSPISIATTGLFQ